MRQSLHSERFPRPLLPCHNNDHYHHCAKRGLSYRYINPGTPRLLWSNFTLICGPVLCTTVSGAVTGDHGSPPSSSEPEESSEGGRRGGVSSQRPNQTSSPAKALKQRPVWSVIVRRKKTLMSGKIPFYLSLKLYQTVWFWHTDRVRTKLQGFCQCGERFTTEIQQLKLVGLWHKPVFTFS